MSKADAQRLDAFERRAIAVHLASKREIRYTVSSIGKCSPDRITEFFCASDRTRPSVSAGEPVEVPATGLVRCNADRTQTE
jgi:hypothetical protein